MTTTSPAESVDALALADYIIAEYAADLTGSAGDALQAVLDRLVVDGDDQLDRARLVARMRGPFLQALSAPIRADVSWPDSARRLRGSFAPAGILPELVDLLSGAGVHRLYAFQETGMAAVLADQDVLITAGTGRGKTESWLIPLLQYALLAKDGHLRDEPVNGTKALLVYPTKALAQDQLRRLIRYLVPLNRHRPPERRITVGIFDGDTPSGGEVGDEDYLYQAFRLFDCPVSTGQHCAVCPHGLVVKPRGAGQGRLTLMLPNEPCARETPLDFVVLTRQDMVREAPDILITNPDMLHLRLLNVNDDAWRQRLIVEPRFLVLDEIHTYAETFGASVSWVIRRLRAARAAAGVVRPLRIVAASATVGNGPELFSRIAGVESAEAAFVQEVSHEPPPVGPPPREELPGAFLEQRWDESATERWVTDRAIAAALGGGALPSDLDGLGEELSARLAATDSGTLPPVLHFVRWLHDELRRRPGTPVALRSQIAARYPALSTEAIAIAFSNALTVARAAGILESRAHLFAWPIDGYYLCAACGRVYLEPQATCQCGAGFVTRLRVCNIGDELSAEGWLCAECLAIYPFFATVDGQYVAYDPPRCTAGHGPRPCVPVVWRPFGRCATCGTIGKAGDPCRHGDGEIAHEGLGIGEICERCGRAVAGGWCECGGHAVRALRLPWICGRCDTPQWQPGRPDACAQCGHRILLLGGLVECRAPEHCSACQADFLAGGHREAEGHLPVPSGRQLNNYSLVDQAGKLYKPSQFREAVPCYHRGASYDLARRYGTLSRSPANVAVTSAQIALRRIVGAADPPDLRGAKLLSFSDSQNDMEQLARDFNDPESETFVDQAIFVALADGPRRLADVVDAVAALVPAYLRESRDWRAPRLESRIVSRFLRGFYGVRLGPPTLTARGLADLYLDQIPEQADVCALLAALASYNGQKLRRLRDTLDWTGERLTDARAAAEAAGWLTMRGEFVRLDLRRLLARRVGPGAPIFRSTSGSFIPTLRQQLNPTSSATPFAIPAELRRDSSTSEFSIAARRIFSTAHPTMLRGATYKGSTARDQRRKLEYGFARRDQPNFLSSGPAMEVGIDIGDLDRVLLYGTPPNVNGYLQRIGRAGRRSKQALVLSVSKRNPIDLYYYRDPLQLIASRPQPVPLQEHNERVVEVALTAALLDFVASNFSIPWIKEGVGAEQLIRCDNEPVRTRSQLPGGSPPLTWLRLLNSPTTTVDTSALIALEDLVVAHTDEARGYLNGLLEYQLCARCDHRAPAGLGTCPRPGCGGALELASVRLAPFVERALKEFGQRIVWAPSSVLDQYISDHLELDEQATALRRERQRAQPRERGEIDRRLREVQARQQVALVLEEEARQARMLHNQDRSAYARYGYGLRGRDDEVAIELVSGGLAEPRVALTSRALGPALREYAPGAVSLHDTDEYVTLAALSDAARTDELRRRLETLDLPQARACVYCSNLDPEGGRACPICGNQTHAVEWMVPGRARAFKRDEALGTDPRDTTRRLYPSHAFPLGGSDTPLESTFVQGGARVLSFEPRASARLLLGAGGELGQLEVGAVEILFDAHATSATYETGEREALPRLFELCGEPGCGGVIAPSVDGKPGFCMIEPGHDIGRRRIVRYGSRLATVGLRLSGLPEGPVAHSLMHGLRAGLEQVAGVLVRSVGEYLTDEAAYLYDTVAGGAGVCELLLDPASEYGNFQTAIAVATALAQCSCEDGCPQCLFQFGCSERNLPSSLSRKALLDLLTGGLRLEAPNHA